MAVKIRLQRRGRKKRPFYHIVVADERSPRDGRFIEKLGTYNPMTSPATIELDEERAYDWLMKGAQPTDTARAILKFRGVMYKKHLQRGVTKGALTQEQADELFEKWLTDKEIKVRDRVNASIAEKAEWYSALSGTPKPVEVIEEEAPVEEAPAAAEATEEAPAEEAPAVEAEATEEAPVEEAPAAEAEATEEAPAEEAPAAEAEATEEAPVEEAPAAEAEATEEAPAEEAPAAEAEATEEAPVEEAPAAEATTEEEEGKKEDGE